MRVPVAVVLGVLSAAWAGAADERPLICFGNEPSWGVDLTVAGSARVMLPGEEPVTYKGVAVRSEPRGEWLWRGTPAAGRDLVVFLREGACSDGMSDTQHPVSARVSLPDLRFLVGCCRIPSAPTAAATLEGPSWRLTSLPGKDAKPLAGLPRPVTARFEAGRVSGFSGCNNLMGSYTIEGDHLKLGPLAGSLMACPEPATSIETAFRAAFSGSLRQSLAGDLLTLTPESGGALTFEREPPQRLEGATWEATGFNNNRQAVVGLQAPGQITFSFAGGSVSGSAGCNSFRAPYTAQGNRIKIGPAVTTRKACGDSLMLQEREFLAALESATVWAIDGNLLDMRRADEQRAVMAKTRAR